MKTIVWLWILLMPSLASALDVTIGHGKFEADASLKGLMRTDMSLDIQSISLAQAPVHLGNIGALWSADITLFQSGFANQVTDFASQPVTSSLPLLGSSVTDLVDDYTALPVPADYRVYGVDFNAALSWPLLESSQGLLGIGVNTGMSFPYMEMRHQRRDANTLLALLDTTSTDIQTLKLGPILHGRWTLTPSLMLQGSWGINRQWGKLSNDLLGSNIRIDGQYTMLDLALAIRPPKLNTKWRWLEHTALIAGYHLTQWRYDRTTLTIRQQEVAIPTLFDTDFKMSQFRLGLAVRF